MNQAADCPYCEHSRFGLPDPQKVAELVAQISIAPSLRANAEIYHTRLAACASCESLRGEVLCAHCGCFVLFRARPVNSYCPHPEGDRWAAPRLPR